MHTEVCAYTFHLRSILTPLNHVMRSVSRHLDPLQADLDNGSVVLQHLTLSVSVCVCAKWSFVYPGLLCHLARSLERQVQAICSLAHSHCTDAVIVKVPHLTDLTALLLHRNNFVSRFSHWRECTLAVYLTAHFLVPAPCSCAG